MMAGEVEIKTSPGSPLDLARNQLIGEIPSFTLDKLLVRLSSGEISHTIRSLGRFHTILAFYKWPLCEFSYSTLYFSFVEEVEARNVLLLLSSRKEVTKKAQEEASEHYKFFVDGEWRHDEHQPFVSGNYGVVNSVFLAREPDVIPASYTPETPGRSRTFHGVSKNAAYSNIPTFLKRRKDTATAAASTFGTKRRKRN
ncbi:hypothetical protein HYC85_025199 [Camellia sinensis]|uniref:AMP-activated protein kinase glycogen-binding domain-containing protein n=1 Tax=Camellia sinensis TaxID=4442 RepID=A0A7J7GAA1_CAMSI|nr:hypothetical protein HYC85_025199 [Camellia sinensis]